MPIKVLMPALSPTMTEGNLAKWLKKEGDKISAGEVIAEIETDKATMEVESVDDGIIAKQLIPEGTEGVLVNSLIAVLVEEDEEDVDINSFIKEHQSAAETNNNDSNKDILSNSTNSLEDNLVTREQPGSSNLLEQKENFEAKHRVFASPLAKRIATMEGVELSDIIGSGPRGRIIKSDILNVIKNGTKPNKDVIKRNLKEYDLIPNNNMRKIIAKRLLESKITVPHFYLSIECIMDDLLKVREQINANFANDKSKKISINDFIILASAKALKNIPEANASWTDNSIIMYNNIDISVAVAVEGGLITPIIKNADQKDITKISYEMKNLAKKAKENSLSPEEFQGGGFTISNLGMYGIKKFSAIINPPQSCIMAVGASLKRPVVIEDKMTIKTVMDVNLSCDHRVIDGAIGAKFLTAFKKYMESPILMFV